MLKKISIKNLGLVNDLRLDFSNGFTVITGETGAGKSFFCRSIELALGSRAQEKFNGRTVVDLEFKDHIFTRVLENGRSRFFIDDIPQPLEEGRKFAERFLNLHSQHDNLFLKNKTAAVELFDRSLENPQIKKDFLEKFTVYKSFKKQREDLEEKLKTFELQKDFWAFQLEKISVVKFSLDDLEEAEKLVKNSQISTEKKDDIIRAVQVLAGEEMSVLSLADTAEGMLKKIDTSLQSELSETFIKIPEIVEKLEKMLPQDDENREQAEKLIQKVRAWTREFGVNSAEELLSKKQVLEENLAQVYILEEQITEVKAREKKSYEEAEKSAKILSSERQKNAENFSSKIQEKCRFLGMPPAVFEVKFFPTQLCASGVEEVEFYFSANQNQELMPLRSVASGGEIARITLALKQFWPSDTVMIFDEIDTGVSGAIAEKMAEEMKNLSLNRQILAITHLPQIAAAADHHFVVEKFHFRERTETRIRKIEGEERVEKIAAMLSGENITPEALAASRRLIGG